MVLIKDLIQFQDGKMIVLVYWLVLIQNKVDGIIFFCIWNKSQKLLNIRDQKVTRHNNR